MPRPRLPETSPGQLRAKQAWNGGKVGKSRAAADHPVVDVCPDEDCGSPDLSGRPPVAAMVRVAGAADGADAHWYCPGRCAAIARARAELRTIPAASGSEQ
ncbi:hypothetical protein [Streptomyces nigra]|uniref:hypothetical protein n=1 Tax=Streptomyces nigra TaxID=1827580 RepID=UPI003643CF48